MSGNGDITTIYLLYVIGWWRRFQLQTLRERPRRELYTP